MKTNPIDPVRRSAACIAATLFLALPFSAGAQADTLTNSRTLLEEGVSQHDQGNYKAALGWYRAVPEGDTNYLLSLHEQAISLMADSAWSECRNICEKALDLPGGGKHRDFLLLLGHALDYSGEHDAAFRLYDSLMTLDPFSYQPWYERGASYALRGDHSAALQNLRRSAMLNPGHFQTHFRIGASLMAQGRPAEAFLVLGYSLFFADNRDQAFAVINMQNAIQQQTDEVVGYWKRRDPARADPAFDEATDILNSKLALSTQYKFKSVLSGDATINTLHAILEKLSYDPADTGFVMQYYVPLLAETFKAGDFDPMVLHMYSGYGIESVESYKRRQSGSVKDFARSVNEYGDGIVSTGVLDYRERKKAPKRYSLVSSEGIFVDGGIKSLNPVRYNEGPVRVYQDGVILATGTANAAGDREGEWLTYHPNGRLHSRQHFTGGKLRGTTLEYRSNGTQEFAYRYDDAGEIVEKREFNPDGVLQSLVVPHRDYADLTSYHRNGTIEYQCKLSKGAVLDPVLKSSFEDGAIASEISFSAGKRHGRMRRYFQNGQLAEESYYKNGELDGSSIDYYDNGELRRKGSFRNGKPDGPYEEFNEDGKPVERGAFSKGHKSGAVEFLDAGGNVYGTVEYRSGAPKSYRFVSAAGKVNAAGQQGALRRCIFYYPDGTRRFEAPLEDGLVQGEASDYYSSGALRRKQVFENDKAEGSEIFYYQNGRKSYEAVNVEGRSYGWYTGFSDAGAKRIEGFLDGEERAGLWTEYFPNREKETETFYVDGKANGPLKAFDSRGRLMRIRYFDRGRVIGVMEYDTSGRLLRRQDFPDGEGVYEEYTQNGRIRFRAVIRHGQFEGPAAIFYPNGSVQWQGFYRDGFADSLSSGFYLSGRPQYAGGMRNGKRHGKWTIYDAAGRAHHVINYRDGEQHGSEEIREDGILYRSISYRNGERNGRELIYSDADHLALVLSYEAGVLRSYALTGPDGKELAAVPLTDGNAAIRASYPDGKPALEMNVTRGLISGPCKRWYRNGQPAHDYNYSPQGDRDGTFTTWSATGQKLSELKYVHDLLCGTETYWDATGKLVYSTERNACGELHGLDSYFDLQTGKRTAVRYDSGYLFGME